MATKRKRQHKRYTKKPTSGGMLRRYGTERFIGEDGVPRTFHILELEEGDKNFDKIWLYHIVEAMDTFGYKKLRFLMHLISVRTRENLVIGTVRSLAKDAKVSISTASATMRTLKENKILVNVNQGCYMINPDVIFRGRKNFRMDVLLRYTDYQKAMLQNEEPEESIFDRSPEAGEAILEEFERIKREEADTPEAQELKRLQEEWDRAIKADETVQKQKAKRKKRAPEDHDEPLENQSTFDEMVKTAE